ncbi:class I SAM-dependent methyltransferase [Geobacter pelophilus]|uniref:Class I SAM-dependent methyltransferase n=1 Tax=Geoanaerobacter pelophilus TaxID=60036 RepID=A0AAW4L0L3_9BACT|nr:class I SAM-dependent methyltransferase [Geoanaerobacter pelophilus]MBT0663020.1 class I SAM-dependent methyltransferase [Geoanaerobacter pelophilus]
MGLFIDKCIVCGELSAIYDKYASSYLSLPSSVRVKKCSCGMRWLYPIPDEEDYINIYSNQYYNHDMLGKGSYNKMIKYKYTWFNLRIDHLAKKYPNHRSILDIGAATGEFIKIAKDKGYAAEGIELSEYACKEALAKNNVFLYNGTIDNYLKCNPNRLFDIVHMGHVFEHFANPDETLNSISSLLNENGILVIEVPNQFNSLEDLIRLYLIKDKIQFTSMSLHHPYFYSKSGLLALVQRHGFQVDHITTNPNGRYLNNIGYNKIILRNLFRFAELALGMGPYIELYAIKHNDHLI